MTINNQFTAFKSQLHNSMVSSGMTFNPSIDCRNDLVNFYGYSSNEVNTMTDDQVFSTLDKIVAAEKGHIETEISLPIHLQNEKCSCGNDLTVLLVDCETRGDCEIYNCGCKTCGNKVSFNYAEEWFECEETDTFWDMLLDLDNACFRGCFDRAREIYQEAITFIENGNDKSTLKEMFSSKLNYLSKYKVDFEQSEGAAINVDKRTLCEVKELSVRAYDCLVRAGYKTVEQVKKATLLDMQKVRNIGNNTLMEIEEVLNVKFV